MVALDLTGREAADYNRVRAAKGNMRQRLAVSLVMLMLTSMMSFGIVGGQNPQNMGSSGENPEIGEISQDSKDIFSQSKSLDRTQPMATCLFRSGGNSSDCNQSFVKGTQCLAT